MLVHLVESDDFDLDDIGSQTKEEKAKEKRHYDKMMAKMRKRQAAWRSNWKTYTTTAKTVEFSFGAAPDVNSPMLRQQPLPQQNKAVLIAGAAAAGLAGLGGVGLGMVAASQASKPETVTVIVTPPPRVVYVPAIVDVPVLWDGTVVQQPLRRLAEAFVRSLRSGLAEADNSARLLQAVNLTNATNTTRLVSGSMSRNMFLGLGAVLVVCGCFVCCCAVSYLLCSKKSKRKRGSKVTKLRPNATEPQAIANTAVAQGGPSEGRPLLPPTVPSQAPVFAQPMRVQMTPAAVV
jgi:hypothetical protein